MACDCAAEAEAFASSMGQAYNVTCAMLHAYLTHTQRSCSQQKKKENKSTTRSRPLFMRCTRRGGQFEGQISPRLSRSSILKDTAQQLSLMRPTHFGTGGRTRSKERCARGAIHWPWASLLAAGVGALGPRASTKCSLVPCFPASAPEPATSSHRSPAAVAWEQ